MAETRSAQKTRLQRGRGHNRRPPSDMSRSEAARETDKRRRRDRLGRYAPGAGALAEPALTLSPHEAHAMLVAAAAERSKPGVVGLISDMESWRDNGVLARSAVSLQSAAQEWTDLGAGMLLDAQEQTGYMVAAAKQQMADLRSSAVNAARHAATSVRAASSAVRDAATRSAESAGLAGRKVAMPIARLAPSAGRATQSTATCVGRGFARLGRHLRYAFNHDIPLKGFDPNMVAVQDHPPDVVNNAFATLRGAADMLGVQIQSYRFSDDRLGEYDPDERVIRLSPEQTAASLLATLSHELSHVLDPRYHDDPVEGYAADRGSWEETAQISSMMVCEALGIDNTRRTNAYVKHWAGRPIHEAMSDPIVARRCKFVAAQVLNHCGVYLDGPRRGQPADQSYQQDIADELAYQEWRNRNDAAEERLQRRRTSARQRAEAGDLQKAKQQTRGRKRSLLRVLAGRGM